MGSNQIDQVARQRMQRVFIFVGIIWTVLNLSSLLLSWNDFLPFGRLGPVSFRLDLFLHLILWCFGIYGLYGSNKAMGKFIDSITEQRNVQIESDQRYRLLVELSPDGIAIHQNGLLVYANPACLHMLGASSPDMVLGKPVLDLVHPDSRAMVLERIRLMSITGKPVPPAEETILQMNGDSLAVEISSTPLFFKGQPAFQVFIRDISERKRLEQAMQAIEKGVSMAFGQAFFEEAAVELAKVLQADIAFIGEYLPGIEKIRTISVCMQGAISENFEYALKGAPCGNVVNQKLCCYESGVIELFPEDEDLKTLGADGYIGMPLWDSDGTATGIIVVLYRRPIPDPSFARGLVQIFASRVQVEIERTVVLNNLRKNQALLETVINAIPYEIWVSDNEGVCILQNPISVEYWGDTVGKQPKDVQEIDGPTQKDWREKNLRALQGEVVREQKQIYVNGQPRYLNGTMTPILLGEQVSGFVGINIDVTERRIAEMQLEESISALKQSQALLMAVIENIPFDFWATDNSGQFILQNAVSKEFWGDAIGKMPWEMGVPENIWKTWVSNNQLALKGEVVHSLASYVYGNGKQAFVTEVIAPIQLGQEVTGSVGISIDITAQKEAENKLLNSLERTSTLREIDQAILGGTDIRVIMGEIIRHAANLLKVDAVEVLRYDVNRFTLEILARKGVNAYSEHHEFAAYDDICGPAVLDQKMILVEDFQTYLKDFPKCRDFEKSGFKTYIAMPLTAKGMVRGILEIFHNSELKPDDDWWQIAYSLCNQAAIAIDNLSLFQGLQRSNAELSLAYDLTLEGWSKALELRDQETEGHTQRVTSLTMRLAEMIGVPKHQIVHMRRGSLLHDIGKMGIPDSILHKAGPLTLEEWAVVKKHPETAYNLLFPIPFLRPALEIPYGHHERWNGSGYPRGLKGQEIHISARIFAVADVWDALISQRPYRQPDPPEVALRYIQENKGILFDPMVVDMFTKLVQP